MNWKLPEVKYDDYADFFPLVLLCWQHNDMCVVIVFFCQNITWKGVIVFFGVSGILLVVLQYSRKQKELGGLTVF